jgi:hypothetical protein
MCHTDLYRLYCQVRFCYWRIDRDLSLSRLRVGRQVHACDYHWCTLDYVHTILTTFYHIMYHYNYAATGDVVKCFIIVRNQYVDTCFRYIRLFVLCVTVLDTPKVVLKLSCYTTNTNHKNACRYMHNIIIPLLQLLTYNAVHSLCNRWWKHKGNCCNHQVVSVHWSMHVLIPWILS